MSEFFDASKPDAIERLARIEGQSNFYSLLAGIEAGPDTTTDMAALAFSRVRGAIPEILEAHVAQSELFKLPLMSIVFDAISAEFKHKPKDYPWIQGAIADAFHIVRKGSCKPLQVRAKRFHIHISAYGTMRKVAHGIFLMILDAAERAWKFARFSASGTTKNRHTVGVEGANSVNQYGMAPGCYFAPPLPTDADGERAGFDTRGLGIEDRLGWDSRQETRPGPVLTLHGAEAVAHRKLFPAQPPLTSDWHDYTGTAYDPQSKF